ncbi:MAG: hypothetical protein R2706_21130 [Acidimicrobiales bacterium]
MLLAEADVILGHWGCSAARGRGTRPGAEARPFRLCRREKNVAATDAPGRDIQVTTSSANAAPVAEFTLAAILFANKGVFGDEAPPKQAVWRRH